MSKNNPPFRIGQRVVCIDDKFYDQRLQHAPIQKGEEYIVLGVNRSCCNWQIDIGMFSGNQYYCCSGCGQWSVPTPSLNHWLKASRFAPIESSHTDATTQIASLFKDIEERADVRVIETVNN